MSQNIIQTRSTTGAVDVISGWDRALQELFCTVIPHDEDDEGDYGAFCFEPFQDIDAIRQALQTAGIVVPEALLAQVAADKTVNAGNAMRTFLPDGTVQVPVALA